MMWVIAKDKHKQRFVHKYTDGYGALIEAEIFGSKEAAEKSIKRNEEVVVEVELKIKERIV